MQATIVKPEPALRDYTSTAGCDVSSPVPTATLIQREFGTAPCSTSQHWLLGV